MITEKQEQSWKMKKFGLIEYLLFIPKLEMGGYLSFQLGEEKLRVFSLVSTLGWKMRPFNCTSGG